MRDRRREGRRRAHAASARSRSSTRTRASASAACRRRRSTKCGSAFAIARGYRATLTRYERAEHPRQERPRWCASARAAIAAPDQRRVGPVPQGRALRGRPRRRRALVRRQRVPEGRRPDLQLRPHAARQAAPRLHAARPAARRDQRDHAVQPPDEPGRAQGRAGGRDQQPDGAQALREGAALGAPLRRPALRGRPAAGDALGRHRRPARDRRRARSPTPTSTSSPSPAASRSARRSPRRPATGAWSSSSAATIRSSSWTTPTSTRRRRSRCRARTRTRASAAPRSSGCWCTQAVAADFTDRVVEKTQALAPRRPDRPGVDMGTVIDEAAARLFEARVDEAVAQGARLLVGNQRRGALYAPTVLDRVRPEMTLVREETFGPVSPIITFDDIDEAIRISTAPPTACRRRCAPTASTTSRASSPSSTSAASTCARCRATGSS